MPKITYIDSTGNQKTIDVAIGLSVMEGAIQNNIPGIDADCGGACSCATCHVFVHKEWLDKLEEIGPTEEAMLSLSPDRQNNSRLACQIPVTEDLSGLMVTTPEFQF